MKHKPVESSNIKAIGYSNKTKTLEIIFHSGSTYSYHPIMPIMYEALMEAESKGGYFQQHIRYDKNITCTKIETDDD